MLPSGRRVVAVLTGLALIAAGCTNRDTAEPSAGTCEIVANGTPVAKTPASTGPVATGYRRDMTAVHTAHYAVATANPLATQAACAVLRDGGSAADAVVAAQAVLGLVEPQSSGVGGGGFLMYYDAATGSVSAYDGREVAPAAADENYLRWIDNADRTAPRPDARASGRSIGVPGIVRMLADAHCVVVPPADHPTPLWSSSTTKATATSARTATRCPHSADGAPACRKRALHQLPCRSHLFAHPRRYDERPLIRHSP